MKELMFPALTYQNRRAQLKRQLGSGVLLFVGHDDSPMNYAQNCYDFRQDSSFLYFFGGNAPRLAGLIDIDADRETLFGDEPSLDDLVWTGPQTSIGERAARCGVGNSARRNALAGQVDAARKAGRRIHFLPPCRAETQIQLEALLGLSAAEIFRHASLEMIRAVVAQRSIKSAEEIAEIERALEVTHDMHVVALSESRPGRIEQEIVARIESVALARNLRMAYPVIFSSRGEILHNHDHSVKLSGGEMIVNDSGANSPLGYASDITRTIPVGGKFRGLQRDIYQIVFDAQAAAIDAVAPGVANREIHLLACRRMVDGLKTLGFFHGDSEEIVAVGAHAIFFQCGVGHMMGLDVHDMEGLGESFVGYNERYQRSEQFGLNYLRLAKPLEAGNVITVEPGVYIIPALLDRWQAEKRHMEFIDYARFQSARGFGGVRIEDDVLVTGQGQRVLGQPIPKRIDEVQALAGD
jgi:Xaa-Pro aminopeptidase